MLKLFGLRSFSVAVIALAAISAPPAFAKKPPDTWDGLMLVKTKKFDLAYLAPNADFKVYNKIMLDPVEAAFQKNWQRDFNNTVRGLDQRITDEEARDILTAAAEGLRDVFAKIYAENGFQVVEQPGSDVMRVRTAVIDLDVAAPDQMTASRTTTFTSEAGAATVVIELRDSMSGALLARGVDRRDIGDQNFMMRRTRVDNRADFSRAFRIWAKISVDALNNLKALNPINADGKQVAAR
jgi:hypothetical protein